MLWRILVSAKNAVTSIFYDTKFELQLVGMILKLRRKYRNEKQHREKLLRHYHLQKAKIAGLHTQLQKARAAAKTAE